MGELRMVMLYQGHVLGWLLAHLLKGLIFACTFPGASTVSFSEPATSGWSIWSGWPPSTSPADSSMSTAMRG